MEEKQISLYLGSLPLNTTEQEISSLLNKISTVKHVYIPPQSITGIERNFAMIQVIPKQNFNKLISSLNNSIWKGSKIRLEIAKEYYTDKINREKIIEQKENEKRIHQQQNPIKTTYPEFNANTISLMTSKYLQKVVQVSTRPVLAGQKYKVKKVLSCRKLLFDDDGHADISTTSQSHITYPADEDVSDNKLSVTEQEDSLDGTPKVKPVPNKPAKPDGGGVRKGFGTLSSSLDNTLTNLATIKDKHSVVSSNSRTSVPKADTILSRDAQMLVDEEANEPCITEEELTQQKLDEERKRSLLLLSSILSRPTATVPAPVTRPTTTITQAPSSSSSTPDPLTKSPTPLNNTTKVSNTSPPPNPTVDKQPYVDLTSLKDIYHREVRVYPNTYSFDYYTSFSYYILLYTYIVGRRVVGQR